MSIGLPPLRLSSASEGTHRIVETAHALLPGGGELAGHDALHVNLLRGADDVLLVRDRPRDDRADEDVHAGEVRLERLEVVVQVADADLDASGAERGDFGLARGGGADERCDALGGAGMGLSVSGWTTRFGW